MDGDLKEILAKITRNWLYVSVLQTVYENIHRYQDKDVPREVNIMELMYRQLSDIVSAVANAQARRTRAFEREGSGMKISVHRTSDYPLSSTPIRVMVRVNRLKRASWERIYSVNRSLQGRERG